ncbi:hypothetical protein [Flavobacterium sp. CSZ]|uniref:hypothetical protein n=1 Tax=Flavobacterium sp. CSZ TaxID=2783791 RepID=UPI00188D292D|nr:hypothetical protein [Flavobacterium sp. CSZ]MBF4483241.1 hypothetical protein [Flavobacterium sp. CSZ]
MNVIEVTLLNTGLSCFIYKDEISAFHDFNTVIDGYEVHGCVISLKSGLSFTTVQDFDTIKRVILGE